MDHRGRATPARDIEALAAALRPDILCEADRDGGAYTVDHRTGDLLLRVIGRSLFVHGAADSYPELRAANVDPGPYLDRGWPARMAAAIRRYRDWQAAGRILEGS